jgi:hypothetical protein
LSEIHFVPAKSAINIVEVLHAKECAAGLALAVARFYRGQSGFSNELRRDANSNILQVLFDPFQDFSVRISIFDAISLQGHGRERGRRSPEFPEWSALKLARPRMV